MMTTMSRGRVMRTQGGTVALGRNGLWYVQFETYIGQAGSEFLANSVSSAALFATSDEAYDAQSRALTVLETTGQFPNMCEKF